MLVRLQLRPPMLLVLVQLLLLLVVVVLVVLVKVAYRRRGIQLPRGAPRSSPPSLASGAVCTAGSCTASATRWSSMCGRSAGIWTV